MYAAHPDFDAPCDQDQLWRYFDLARYLDLLIREQLFFSNIENMEDPWEGWAMDTGFRPQHPSSQLFTVSSWHNNDEENYAMWKIYAPGTAGLAIQTTFQRLRDAFAKTDKTIWIGKVSYYNQKQDTANAAGNKLYLQKRSVFAFEKEVRCCFQPDPPAPGHDKEPFKGVYIPLDLDQLIHRIYISPYAPAWFRDLIAGINKKFGIDKKIIHSDVLGEAL